MTVLALIEKHQEKVKESSRKSKGNGLESVSQSWGTLWRDKWKGKLLALWRASPMSYCSGASESQHGWAGLYPKRQGCWRARVHLPYRMFWGRPLGKEEWKIVTTDTGVHLCPVLRAVAHHGLKDPTGQMPGSHQKLWESAVPSDRRMTAAGNKTGILE